MVSSNEEVSSEVVISSIAWVIRYRVALSTYCRLQGAATCRQLLRSVKKQKSSILFSSLMAVIGRFFKIYFIAFFCTHYIIFLLSCKIIIFFSLGYGFLGAPVTDLLMNIGPVALCYQICASEKLKIWFRPIQILERFNLDWFGSERFGTGISSFLNQSSTSLVVNSVWFCLVPVPIQYRTMLKENWSNWAHFEPICCVNYSVVRCDTN